MMTTAHTYSNAINVVRAIQLHFEGGCRSGSRLEAFLLGRRVFYSLEEGHALQIRRSIAYQGVSRRCSLAGSQKSTAASKSTCSPTFPPS
jgi:hypothetical protein